MEGEIIVQAAVCAAKESRTSLAQPQVRLACGYLSADGALKLFGQGLRQKVNPVYPVQQRRIPSGCIPGKIRIPEIDPVRIGIPAGHSHRHSLRPGVLFQVFGHGWCPVRSGPHGQSGRCDPHFRRFCKGAGAAAEQKQCKQYTKGPDQRPSHFSPPVSPRRSCPVCPYTRDKAWSDRQTAWPPP